MSMTNLRTTAMAAGVVLAILSSGLSSPAFACSYSKLDLDYCGATPRVEHKPVAPLYKPEFEKPPRPLPDPHPTIVAPRDSRGRPAYGPGIVKRF
jgi:hypothetical protein